MMRLRRTGMSMAFVVLGGFVAVVAVPNSLAYKLSTLAGVQKLAAPQARTESESSERSK